MSPDEEAHTRRKIQGQRGSNIRQYMGSHQGLLKPTFLLDQVFYIAHRSIGDCQDQGAWLQAHCLIKRRPTSCFTVSEQKTSVYKPVAV
jgi:hypothetical protein